MRFKSNRFTADCVSNVPYNPIPSKNKDTMARQNKLNNSQQIAEFKAGSIILPANTGKDNNNKIAVTKIAHTNTIYKNYPAKLDIVLNID